jgi:hypothetical protein
MNRAKLVNEKFVKDSDPDTDMGVGVLLYAVGRISEEDAELFFFKDLNSAQKQFDEMKDEMFPALSLFKINGLGKITLGAPWEGNTAEAKGNIELLDEYAPEDAPEDEDEYEREE